MFSQFLSDYEQLRSIEAGIENNCNSHQYWWALEGNTCVDKVVSVWMCQFGGFIGAHKTEWGDGEGVSVCMPTTRVETAENHR